MSDIRYLVVHYNGKLVGNLYSDGTSRALAIRHEVKQLSTVRGLVRDILAKESNSDFDFDIYFRVNLDGDLVMMEIKVDQDVETLFASTTTPAVYVARKYTKQRNVTPNFNSFHAGTSSSFAQKGGFVNLMNSFHCGKDSGRFFVPDAEEYLNHPDHISESTTDTDTGTKNEDLSNDASGDSDGYDSFEKPADIPFEDHIPCENTCKTSRPWNIPGIPYSSPIKSVDVHCVDDTPGVLSDDSTFMSKQEMQTSVGYYHLLNAVEYRVKRSNSSRWYLKCKFVDCEFVFRAIGIHDLWRTSKFIPHTCRVNPDCTAPRSLPSKVIGAFYAANQKDKATALSPKKLLSKLKTEHGLNLLYCQALRAQKCANELIYGNDEESFTFLPSYLDQLLRANPDSYVKLDVDKDNDKFKFVFFALRASINGFLKFGRPVIVVDGTHLKGKFKGVLFVAVTQDCNHQIFPLAVGIGHLENNEGWTRFLQRLRESFGCPRNLLIVSDQHKSIIHAMSVVYPDAAHGLCYFHLQKKFAVYSRELVHFFRRAAYTYRLSDYNRFMDCIKCMDSGKIVNTLINAKPERWSRVHCPVPRYEFMTSNAAETWNKSILHARQLPIVYVLENIRKIIQDWFHARFTAAQFTEKGLCSRVYSHLSKLSKLSDKFVVEPLCDGKFKVVNGMNSHLVNLTNRTCECCEFQSELIPCSHAVAAIRECGVGRSCPSLSEIIGWCLILSKKWYVRLPRVQGKQVVRG
ncbi:hypothetical protein ACS0TY_001593 [Phlomoides rotata]